MNDARPPPSITWLLKHSNTDDSIRRRVQYYARQDALQANWHSKNRESLQLMLQHTGDCAIA